MLITIDELNEFSGNFEETVTLKDTIIASASDVVINFLGFDPIVGERIYRSVGWGQDYLCLPIQSVVNITKIEIDGIEIPSADYEVEGNKVLLLNNKIFARSEKIVVTYMAGLYDPNIAEPVPPDIKHATLRIAALMLDETHGNIGVTGKSFADLSKTFINYSNYDKYLKPLAHYRAEVI